MTNTNHNYRRARKTETPCRWCIYGLLRAEENWVQCILFGRNTRKGHTCDQSQAVRKWVPMGDATHGVHR